MMKHMEKERSQSEQAMCPCIAIAEGPDCDIPVVIFQLLSGRDFAADVGNPLHASARSMANYAYGIVCMQENTCLLVDAAWDISGICDSIKKTMRSHFGKEVNIIGSVYTHNHFDHAGGKVPKIMTGGADVLIEGCQDILSMGCNAFVGSGDGIELRRQCSIDTIMERKASGVLKVVEDGEAISVGACMAEVLHTPGHTPGSICISVTSNHTKHTASGGSKPAFIAVSTRAILTGDTLFIGGCGRVDLPGSDPHAMVKSLALLSELDDTTVVLPGHNYAPEPFSTVEKEREGNPHMQMAIRRAGKSKALRRGRVKL